MTDRRFGTGVLRVAGVPRCRDVKYPGWCGGAPVQSATSIQRVTGKRRHALTVRIRSVPVGVVLVGLVGVVSGCTSPTRALSQATPAATAIAYTNAIYARRFTEAELLVLATDRDVQKAEEPYLRATQTTASGVTVDSTTVTGNTAVVSLNGTFCATTGTAPKKCVSLPEDKRRYPGFSVFVKQDTDGKWYVYFPGHDAAAAAQKARDSATALISLDSVDVHPGETFAVHFGGTLTRSHGGYLWLERPTGTRVALLRSDGNPQIPMGYQLDMDKAAMLDDAIMVPTSNFLVPLVPTGAYQLCTANSGSPICAAINIRLPRTTTVPGSAP